MKDTPNTLTPKQLRFCQEYVVDFNAKAAAIRTGYSDKTSKQIGYENLRKPQIKQEIEKLIAERHIGPKEVTKILSDIATSCLNDCFKFIQVPECELIKQPLLAIINKKEEDLELEKQYGAKVGYRGSELKRHNKLIESMRRELIRLKIELGRNPDAYRFIEGEPKIVDRAVFDLTKLIEYKELGRIKTLKHNKYGIHVELLDAHTALTNLARIHGLMKSTIDIRPDGNIEPETWLLRNNSLNRPLTSSQAKKFLEDLYRSEQRLNAGSNPTSSPDPADQTPNE